MRIISGRARGTKLMTLEGLDTRPTTDRVKESLFNLLQYDFYNKRILDLFAGSGALGLEAISRGAESAIFVDMNKASIEIIRKNAEKTRSLEEAKLVQGECVSAIHRLEREAIDLIFMDPPYSKDYVEPVLQAIINDGILKIDGIIVIEHAKNDVWNLPDALELVKTRTYGITSLTIYRRAS